MEGPRTAGTDQPVKPANFLALDASILDDKEDIALIREYVKLDRIEFHFPDGLASVPVVDECRAICDLENFDIMYDLTMQYLTGKTMEVYIRDDDGSRRELGKVYVPNKMFDLRAMDAVVVYPYIVSWLVEFMAAHLSKKFPLPEKKSAPPAGKSRKKTRAAKPKPTS